MMSNATTSQPVVPAFALDDVLSNLSPSSNWKWKDGLLANAKPRDFYWGEIPQPEMQRVVEVAEQKGWRHAVNDLVATKHPDLLDMILAEDRVEWLHLLPHRPRTILDVGSGWGQTSHLMAADSNNTVVAVEPIKERAQFQAIRKQQDNVSNWHVINSDFEEVEFAEGIFDLVSFTGVLEWVGVGHAPKNPRDVQLDALRRAHRSLADDGLVSIGIENRIGFNNILGAVDHSGLRFTSLMPRGVADMYVKLRKKSYREERVSASYRTYTYTGRGYEKLLKDAGFRNVQIFIAHPHYAHPQCLLYVKSKEVGNFFSNVYRPTSKKDAIFSLIFRNLSRLRAAGMFAPHFIVWGHK